MLKIVRCDTSVFKGSCQYISVGLKIFVANLPVKHHLYTDPKLFVQLSIPFRQIKKEETCGWYVHNTYYSVTFCLYRSQASVHLRLAEQTLLTLTGYLDWVKFAVLYTQNCIILQMLCLLLEEDALKIRAADCLLMIVSRKVSIRFWETSCPPMHPFPKPTWAQKFGFKRGRQILELPA